MLLTRAPNAKCPALGSTPPLHPSTKVPASTLINTLIQPEDVTMKIVSFRKAPPPLNGAFPGDRV
jgi:hypothetical protein